MFASSTVRDELAISGHTYLAAAGQILLAAHKRATFAAMALTVLSVTDWGSVPDYLIVLSIVGGALSLVVQRRWDRQQEAEERSRQARLEDLRQAWAALAPLVARPGGFDEDGLAQPFAAAMRQLQLSGSESVLVELEKVTSSLVRQGTHGTGMAVDLGPLTEAVRNDYRHLLDLEPATRQFAPFAIVPREVADGSPT